MGAYDLLAKIKSNADRPAAPPTVYRTLDFLLEKGLIHRLTSINAYIPCCHPREGHQAAFLICTDCKSVTEVLCTRIITTTSMHFPQPMVLRHNIALLKFQEFVNSVATSKPRSCSGRTLPN